MKILVGLVTLLLVGCTIRNEVLYVGGELLTVEMVNNKPKVRVGTGIDECRFRGRVQLSDLDDGEHNLNIECKVPTDYFIPRMD